MKAELPPTAIDYETVIGECAAGREQALRRLYEAEADRLLGIAWRITRRRELAEDAVHETFLRIWRKAASFDPRLGSGRAWITTILRNQALNAVRGLARTEALDEAALERVPDCAEAPDEALARIDDAARLKTCLQSLDETKRTSILLAYVDGLTQPQIAERLGTPHNTVKAWIRRGLLALRECLQ